MKTIILVWGAGERGKSEGIKRLAMSFPYESIIRSWENDDYDSYIIGTVKDYEGKDRIVGIENQGDPGSCQKRWILECVKHDCEVIVAASRSYGQTVNDVYRIASDNNYEVVEVTTFYHRGGPVLPNHLDLRDAFANSMRELILDCLK